MIAELGQFSLGLALAMSVILGAVPLAAAHWRIPQWMALAGPAAGAQLLCVGVAYAALTTGFLNGDFSIAYVANNSNSALPSFYRVTAVWGGHEGSILLWSLILAGWTAAVAWCSGSLPPVLRARVLGTLGLVSTGFLLFILTTSNPFERLLPAPPDGHDLNPLLQDVGMIIHPPMLYMGYVGLAVPFAFAVASLLGGRLDATWTRWTRPWTTVAWVFLTLGIALGSWWAYYELGWGGWWFWDPVENASFMPWLVATALLHSLAVTEQRMAFRAWTILLAIFGFSLSLLGTFLVRSGVLVSVHAFATDPTRGTFILLFLLVVIGGALSLYAWRAHRLSGGGRFDFLSRETLLLVNNVALVVACGTVLLGTLYPLIVDALALGKISVGPPYFDSVFMPLMVPILVLLGFAPTMRWKRDSLPRLLREARVTAMASLLIGAAAFVVVDRFGPIAAASSCFVAWIVLSTVGGLIGRLRPRGAATRQTWSQRIGRSYLGMSVAHLGVAVFVAGVVCVNSLSDETDVLLRPGESTVLNGYEFRFDGVTEQMGPNYRARVGSVVVTSSGTPVTTLFPEKRHYLRQEQPMTEAAIDARLDRDLYVALGEPRGQGAWSIRVQFKAWVRLIWLGALLMALGGLIAVSDRRYRLGQRAVSVETDAEPESHTPPARGETPATA